MTEPTARPYHNLSNPQLEAKSAEADGLIAQAKAIKADVAAELAYRYESQIAEAFKNADKEFGKVTLDLPDNYGVEHEIRKTVSWDSNALLQIASGMPWERVKALFKIEFSVPEKVYTGVAITDPDLRERLDKARTVTPKPQPFKLLKKEG